MRLFSKTMVGSVRAWIGTNLVLAATLPAQGLVVDPAGSFAGLAFSAGMRLVLGD